MTNAVLTECIGQVYLCANQCLHSSLAGLNSEFTTLRLEHNREKIMHTSNQSHVENLMATAILSNIESGEKAQIEKGLIQARSMHSRANTVADKKFAKEIEDKALLSLEIMRLISEW